MRENLGWTLFRELKEEVGLRPQDVKLLGQSSDVIVYNYPDVETSARKHARYKGKVYHWYAAYVDEEVAQRQYQQQLKQTERSGKEPEFKEIKWVDLSEFVKSDNTSGGPWQQLQKEFGHLPAQFKNDQMPSEIPPPSRGLLFAWRPLPRLSR